MSLHAVGTTSGAARADIDPMGPPENHGGPPRSAGRARLRRIAGVLVVLVAACDESLPPRSDPLVFLETSWGARSPVVIVESGIVTAGQLLLVRTRNVYKDVLSEREGIGGRLELTLLSRPEIHRSLAIRSEFLLTPQARQHGDIVIGVDSAVTLGVPWDHRREYLPAIDASPGFWEYVGVHRQGAFYESDSVHVLITGKVKLFEKLPPMPLPPLEYVFLYRLYNTPINPPP